MPEGDEEESDDSGRRVFLLRPGDTLYMPPGWAHEVSREQPERVECSGCRVIDSSASPSGHSLLTPFPDPQQLPPSTFVLTRFSLSPFLTGHCPSRPISYRALRAANDKRQLPRHRFAPSRTSNRAVPPRRRRRPRSHLGGTGARCRGPRGRSRAGPRVPPHPAVTGGPKQGRAHIRGQHRGSGGGRWRGIECGKAAALAGALTLLLVQSDDERRLMECSSRRPLPSADRVAPAGRLALVALASCLVKARTRARNRALLRT